MYEKLISEFKKQLIDRKFEKILFLSLSALFLIFLIVSFILWSICKHWLVMLSSCFVLFFLCGTVTYTIIFMTVRKKGNLRSKDYLKFKRVMSSLKSLSQKDVQILLPIIKSLGINTRAKVQEAIKHYQFVLLQKSNKGFAIISVLSLTIAVAGIILSAINYQSGKDLIVLLILLCSLIFLVALVCICLKIFYRSFYYYFSDYPLYERIEGALSEIWMKMLI